MDVLRFDPDSYMVRETELDGRTIRYRAFENLVYVRKPADVQYQKMNIYVPEVYYTDPEQAPFEWKEAPILLPNAVGGYMPGLPQEPGRTFAGLMNAAFYALEQGYVVASPGARGRGLKNKEGKFTGAAPACIVDLKAAVRYLRFNRDRIPGNTERIISNGTSAGGALSCLLGSTGNHPDYFPFLEEIGAAEERDDIFAASCYCPITDLDHADMAYEWEFGGLDHYYFRDQPEGCLTEEQKMLGEEEKRRFPEYLNSLELRDEKGNSLSLNPDGSGSFRNYIARLVLESAAKERGKGKSLAEFSWLDQNGQGELDWDGYIRYRTRMKPVPAFDDTGLETPENELFCSEDAAARHFTEFSFRNSRVNGEMADRQQICMMNPLNYMRSEKSTVCSHFRIRHGTVDRDTSLAVSAILALSLRKAGVCADYALPWGIPHSGDYDLEELFAWIRSIIK